MTLRIQYTNGNYDYVNNRTLDTLIDQDLIRQFYRPSEKKWIDIEADPVRERIRVYSMEEQRWVNMIGATNTAKKLYGGAERRQGLFAA
jgi:hypothetical protein